MAPKLNVLLIEDIEDDALFLVHELRREGFETSFKRVDTAADMIAALNSQQWDVVLADYRMPRFDGLLALQILRKHDADLPFIVVSGQIGEETAVELMKAGAQDYVMKSNLYRLVPAIRRELIEADNKRARRVAEEQLRGSEELFRTLAKVSQVGIIMLSLTAETIYLNNTGCEILGLSLGELDGTGWMRSFHPDDRQSFLDGLLSAIKTDAPYEAEHRILQKHGEFRWILTLAMASKDAQGRTTSYVGTMTDITELKRQQEDLRRLNHALKALSKCNEIVARAENEEQLLNDVCQAIEGDGGYSLSWAESSKMPEGNLSTRLKAESNTQRRVSGVKVRDYLEYYESPPISNDAAIQTIEPDMRQSVCLLLRSDSSGSNGDHRELKIYNRNTGRLTDHEISILEELSADISFGILNLRLREERNTAQRDSLDYQRKLRQSLEEALQALAATTEMRDPYTSGHQQRVAELASRIAIEMGLSQERIHGIHLAGVVHDIGKIHIPAEILAKPSKLSNIEFELIKTHAQAGYDILKGVAFPWPIADIVWQHHERLDGSGYPRGLKDGEILLETKIISVADVVEAMASHRPYRAGLGIDVALQEILRGRGTLYDPFAVDACVALFREKHFEFTCVNALQ